MEAIEAHATSTQVLATSLGMLCNVASSSQVSVLHMRVAIVEGGGLQAMTGLLAVPKQTPQVSDVKEMQGLLSCWQGQRASHITDEVVW